jgi:ribonuclease HII
LDTRWVADRLVGIDEVGRGSLAGPVVAAAVLYDPLVEGLPWSSGIRDSKTLTRKAIERAGAKIVEAMPYGIGQSSAAEIDQFGITRATVLAMERALERLYERAPEARRVTVVVDGNSQMGHAWLAVVKGDARVRGVSAASIVAKDARDRLMRGPVAARFPLYGFESHVGYGTRRHMAAIREHGPCEEHRTTFKGVR